VQGGYAVQGLQFHVQVADGGPEAGGSSDGPAIQAVDLVGSAASPTVFTGNTLGPIELTALPQVQAWDIAAADGTVAASGVLAKLMIDTSGFWKDAAAGSTWPLLLADTVTGSTYFLSPAENPVRAIAVSGTLTLNTPPGAVDSRVITAEDTAYTFAAGDFAFSDADSGDELSTVRIVSLPATGTLTFAGMAATWGQVISVTELAAGRLQFLPAPETNGEAYTTFLFQVGDGMQESASSAAMTVDVTAANDPPTADDQWLSVLEDGTTDVTLTGWDPDGDALNFVIIEPPAHGSLTGSVPDLQYSPAVDYHGPDSFTFVSRDGILDSPPATVSVSVLPVSDVVGRYVFYNDSIWDGNAAANADDDLAIAADKQALLPGQQAEFEHYTSYDKGLNGLLIDIDDLPGDAVLTPADFQFHAGNGGDLAAWPLAPQPDSVTLRPGAGVGGSTRVTLIWAEQSAVRNQWLQVTILATPNTNLPEADIFYFGNAVGESGLGNSVGSSPQQPLAYFPVNVTDEIGARNHAQSGLDPAGLDNAFDFNRDGLVDEADELLARTLGTNFRTALRRLNLSTAIPAEPLPDDGQGDSMSQIVVGTHVLEPDTPGQMIPIYVTGGWPVQGLNFDIQVADGGPAAGGAISGPAITAVDLLTDTIFAADNTGMRLDVEPPAGDDPVPQQTYRGTSTAVGTVAADGLLAMVTIDTTGFVRGAWSLTISNTVNGSTDFAGLPASLVDGVILVRGTWTNPVAALDVDGNGRVTPLDALVIINYLNANSLAATLPLVPELPPPYYDANRDDAGTPADVLAVINYLNAHASAASAEGESPADRPTTDAPIGAPTGAASPTPADTTHASGLSAARIPASDWRQPAGLGAPQAALPVSAGFPARTIEPTEAFPGWLADDLDRILDDITSPRSR